MMNIRKSFWKSTHSFLGVMILFVLLSSLLIAEEKVRKWTAGEKTVSGKFVQLEDEIVHIELKSGKITKVRLDKLSEKDQTYVESVSHGGVEKIPMPAKMKLLRKQIAELEKKIADLKQGKGNKANNAAEKELETLRQACEAEWKVLDEASRNALENAMKLEPDKQATDFLELRPKDVENAAFLKCVNKRKELLQREEDLQTLRDQNAERMGSSIDKLTEQLENLQDDLAELMPAFQEKVLVSLLGKCKGYRDKSAKLPVEELGSMVSVIQQYDFGWDEEVIWMIAEEVWNKCRPCVGRKKLTQRMIDMKIAKVAVSHKAGERKVRNIGGVDYAFRWCPKGDFTMGSSDQERGRNGWFERRHKVTLTQGFWMLETEVTQSMWYAVMGGNPSSFRGGDMPVETVTWAECAEFCQKLSDLSGLPISLPTDAQWEYACRAGTDTQYAGDGGLEGMGWYEKNSDDETHPVGTKEPNAWGLYDMHGNVWEWCADWAHGYDDKPDTDPSGKENGNERFTRGGSYSSRAEMCRSASHGKEKATPYETYSKDDLGFRILWIPEESELAEESDASVPGDRRRRKNALLQTLVSDVDNSLWMYRNGTFAQMNGGGGSRNLLLGGRASRSKGWNGYEISLKAKKNYGDEGFMVLFCCDETLSNGYILNIGGERNHKILLQKIQNGQRDQTPQQFQMECRPPVQLNIQYTVRVRIEGNNTVKVFINNLLVMNQPLDPSYAGNHCFGIRTWSTSAAFSDIQVRDLKKKVLLDVAREEGFFASQADVMVSTSQVEPQAWKYVTSMPENQWNMLDYNDTAWSVGKGAFGLGSRSLRLNTLWNTSDIWLRKEFTLDEIPDTAILFAAHDDHGEIFLNGQSIARLDGCSHMYKTIPLPPDKLQLLRKGKNVLAVYCHNNGGEQGIDVGLMGKKE